jgi:transcriptional regulator with XRE-family HTH domain
MTFNEFKQRLKECNLTIKEFAEICGLNPNSISTTWKSKNETPRWVDTWLDNYLIAKNIDEFCEKFCSDKDDK